MSVHLQQPVGPPARPRRGRRVLLSGIASDAHTWNLVYLQLLLEEAGHQVTNLGACVPVELLVSGCKLANPELIVLSSVNGHGYQEARLLIDAVRAEPELASTTAVIGGKLGTAGPDPRQAGLLIEAGFDAVFEEGSRGIEGFHRFMYALTEPAWCDE